MGSKINPGRLAAFEALKGVNKGESIERAARQWSFSDRDRALAWHLIYGVLRRQGQLDDILNRFTKGGIKSLKTPVLIVLRMGLFECAFSRTPNHAAISQAVEIIKKSKHRFASGLVNAVLRKSQSAELGPLSLNVPEWLREAFSEHPEWLIEKPAVHIVLSKDVIDKDVIATDYREERAVPNISGIRPYSDDIEGLYIVDESPLNIQNWPGYRRGDWWVMDPAAARVVDIGHEVLGRPSHFRALDCCAAPGGKTWRLIQKGADVTATDASISRLERLKEGAERLNMHPEVHEWDWTKGPLEGQKPFDMVLVDAPCSGTGVIRRHPEIRWRRLPTDIIANQILQKQILRHASQLVAADGVLVYSVCSVLSQEGAAVLSVLEGWTLVRSLATFPKYPDEDGFQIFVLKKG